ncbi:O-Methyltransferase involved in polyketide biosynthesis [Thermomonospora echinospora]|uniref:O-Methyltransferase involved in polyketide biosynthesis n=2 Tax=Thermomonospora echinospora TaxID=1992 RepID=A0A1H5VJU9_9ACTN|nr:O-Methyltransferase involved in polyketide biosynthesis [Thermomonospora echinospora]
MSSPSGPGESSLDRPHSARIWNYWLGGRDYYPADKEAGDAMARIIPGVVDSARADRAFLGRCVRHLVVERGVRQFLDIGAGLPTAGNTHEIAQRLAPESRVVYMDNDPLVLAHAQSLLIGTPQGAARYVEADLRHPDGVLERAAETLDLTRPVALMLLGVLNHITDDAEAGRLVRHLVEAVPRGSYLAIAHPTDEVRGDVVHEAMWRYMKRGGTPTVARDRTRLARFFEGLELLEPGVVPCAHWRPDPSAPSASPEFATVCAVARKPARTRR